MTADEARALHRDKDDITFDKLLADIATAAKEGDYVVSLGDVRFQDEKKYLQRLKDLGYTVKDAVYGEWQGRGYYASGYVSWKKEDTNET